MARVDEIQARINAERIQYFWTFSAFVDNRLLVANVVETVTKAAAYDMAVITVDADCWVRRGANAVIPAADVADGTGSTLLPAGSSRLINFNDGAGARSTAQIMLREPLQRHLCRRC